uniref:Uncharacterized protein n=2 Tax=Oryza sativa subsp. japonica TaxID=39947 RepID=Q6ERR0_ORYSJ|nr:hypothetical protein [Oryza sativa Japonica Group]BAD33486.1 hypothetical protein [Oryza sativa Japonica Group]
MTSPTAYSTTMCSAKEKYATLSELELDLKLYLNAAATSSLSSISTDICLKLEIEELAKISLTHFW